jgi:hypothetical protein
VTSTFYFVSNYWKSFLASIVGAMMINIFYWAREDDMRQVFLILEQDMVTHPYAKWEYLIFIAMGFIFGIISVCYLKLHQRFYSITQFYRRKKPIAMTVVASLITSLLVVGSGAYMFGHLSVLSVLTDALVDGDSTEMVGRENMNIYAGLVLTFIIRTFLTIMGTNCPVPAGTFMPTLLIGAIFGRLIGVFVQDMAGPESSNIYVEGYALVGAVAFCGGVTTTVSVAVVAVEITGQIHMLLPCLIGAVISSGITHSTGLSIYDQAMVNKGLQTFALLLLHSSENTVAVDLMDEEVYALHSHCTVGNLVKLCELTTTLPESEFPVLEPFPSMKLIGAVSRKDIFNYLYEKFKVEEKLELLRVLLTHDVNARYRRMRKKHSRTTKRTRSMTHLMNFRRSRSHDSSLGSGVSGSNISLKSFSTAAMGPTGNVPSRRKSMSGMSLSSVLPRFRRQTSLDSMDGSYVSSTDNTRENTQENTPMHSRNPSYMKLKDTINTDQHLEQLAVESKDWSTKTRQRRISFNANEDELKAGEVKEGENEWRSADDKGRQIGRPTRDNNFDSFLNGLTMGEIELQQTIDMQNEVERALTYQSSKNTVDTSSRSKYTSSYSKFTSSDRSQYTLDETMDEESFQKEMDRRSSHDESFMKEVGSEVDIRSPKSQDPHRADDDYDGRKAAKSSKRRKSIKEKNELEIALGIRPPDPSEPSQSSPNEGKYIVKDLRSPMPATTKDAVASPRISPRREDECSDSMQRTSPRPQRRPEGSSVKPAKARRHSAAEPRGRPGSSPSSSLSSSLREGNAASSDKVASLPTDRFMSITSDNDLSVSMIDSEHRSKSADQLEPGGLTWNRSRRFSELTQDGEGSAQVQAQAQREDAPRRRTVSMEEVSLRKSSVESQKSTGSDKNYTPLTQEALTARQTLEAASDVESEVSITRRHSDTVMVPSGKGVTRAKEACLRKSLSEVVDEFHREKILEGEGGMLVLHPNEQRNESASRSTSGYFFNMQSSHSSVLSANPESVKGASPESSKGKGLAIKKRDKGGSAGGGRYGILMAKALTTSPKGRRSPSKGKKQDRRNTVPLCSDNSKPEEGHLDAPDESEVAFRAPESEIVRSSSSERRRQAHAGSSPGSRLRYLRHASMDVTRRISEGFGTGIDKIKKGVDNFTADNQHALQFYNADTGMYELNDPFNDDFEGSSAEEEGESEEEGTGDGDASNANSNDNSSYSLDASEMLAIVPPPQADSTAKIAAMKRGSHTDIRKLVRGTVNTQSTFHHDDSDGIGAGLHWERIGVEDFATSELNTVEYKESVKALFSERVDIVQTPIFQLNHSPFVVPEGTPVQHVYILFELVKARNIFVLKRDEFIGTINRKKLFEGLKTKVKFN